MNSRRSYLDSLNLGRQRRSYASLDQLNRSLETLEERIERSRDDRIDYARASGRRPAYEADYAPRRERRPAYEQPYQSIARDIERVRGQEDGVAAFGRIAGELKELREELRHQMGSGVRREFEALRKDMERVTAAGAGKAAGRFGHDLERLSGIIQTLSEKSDDRGGINKLRLEVEQMRDTLGTLAREETVRSVDRRVNEFESRMASKGGKSGDAALLSALAQRIDEINQAVTGLPQSLSLQSLEDKVRTLAGALDHFMEQQGGHVSQTFGQIEERLDEISRAIVAATVAAQQPHIDPEPFERIEARIAALARQIEEVADERPTEMVIDRLNLLSQRIDEVAARSVMPEATIERLTGQIALIADKLEGGPAIPDAGEIFDGIEQRFDLLTGMIERRQGDAMEHGNALLRELEKRLDEVADKIDRRHTDAALDTDGIMGAIDARFSALQKRLEDGARDDASGAAIRGLEARLEDISGRLEASATQFSGIDRDLIRNLEAQVAGLSGHLARPSAALPEFEDLGPRLDEIERSIAGSRDSVLEAARQAAETAARSLSGISEGESAAVAGLAGDLKSLEALTRRSDERNGKTFEAIHDTLLKIVDRLGSLENETRAAVQPRDGERVKSILRDMPSMDSDDFPPLDGPLDAEPRHNRATVQRSPAQAAAAAAVAAMGETGEAAEQSGRMRSLLGGLSRKLGRKEQAAEAATQPAGIEDPAIPSVDLDAPLDPKAVNRPLEPGSGAPDLNAIMKRVRDERGQPVKHSETEAAKSDFIAAARRAAKAAAAEAEILKRGGDLKGGPVKSLRLGDLLKARRKPILMAAAAIMMALAGLQLGKVFMSDATETASYEEPAIVSQELDTASLGATSAPDAVIDDMADLPTAPARDVTAAMQTPPSMPEMPAAPSEATAMPEDAEVEPAMDVAAIGPDTVLSETVIPAAIEVPADAGPLPLREAANAGDAKALFEVATRYSEGRGTKADPAAAARWYETAAELGFAPAQYRIGNFYEKGMGVTRDLAKAKQFYKAAAEQGNASAMHNLAVLHAMGADGTTDNNEAARWFVQAADFGVRDSQFNLGILAAKGVGMPQDLEASYKWFALVAKAGDKDAAAKRDEIANALRPEQLERARATTELWKAKPLDPEANTVDIPDSWREGQDRTASIDMGKAITNIQAILNKNGYDAGKPDGVMGERTRAAVAAFQSDNDMPATGEVDEALVRKLLERK